MRLPKSGRGAAVVAALAVPLLTLTACGSGNNAQTQEIKPDNAAATVGTIKVQNATVVTGPQRDPEGPAAVVATLFNNGDTAETLAAVTVKGVAKPAELRPAKGSGKVTVPAHGSVVLGGKGNATAVLAGGTGAVKDGAAQPVTFLFSKTGAVRLDAFVNEGRSYFSAWGPSETPSPSTPASESPSGDASGFPSDGPSGSSSGSPSNGASGEPGGGAASDSASGNPAGDGSGDTGAGNGGDAIGSGQ
ncbi:copper chaperone PCu(A)C [Streptomyces sp. NPDC050560]|uniref:copper chaperone PCu(A)C n=1 Tax=Streptomyces sp. NPDC050560 TaxID=3365630 RepID=UPI0037AC47B3